MGASTDTMSWMFVAVVFALVAPLNAQGGWRSGRATFYGNEPWLWSIHEGSCGYGYIWPDEPLGWDVAALPDSHYEYDGSCGTCYEVACDPMVFKDNYGNELDRLDVCFNPEQSVVVRITDTCPCNYNDNYYSNKRWCCGDMDHFDISVHAFEKLADMKWGVIGLKYRPVSCDHQPANPAPVPQNPWGGVAPPAGASKPWPPRFVSTGSRAPAPVVQDQQDDAEKALEPEALEPEVVAFAGPKVTKGSIISGQIMEGWSDSSWYSEAAGEIDGPSGQKALCKKIYPGGAVSFSASEAKFDTMMSMEFWVKTDQGVPDLNINLEGPQGVCRMVKMQDLSKSGSVTSEKDGFQRYTVYLGLFDRVDDELDNVKAFAAAFQGCGGNVAGAINKIVFRNDLPWHEQIMCIDAVRLLGAEGAQ